MDFNTAVNVVRGAIPAGDDQIHEARTVIARAVCDSLEIAYASDEAERLSDWLAAGEYSGGETPESLAREWRSE